MPETTTKKPPVVIKINDKEIGVTQEVTITNVNTISGIYNLKFLKEQLIEINKQRDGIRDTLNELLLGNEKLRTEELAECDMLITECNKLGILESIIIKE
jgi:hypothetical protein